MKKWTVKTPELSRIQPTLAITGEHPTSPSTLHTSHSPLLMKDMAKAVELIKKKLVNGGKITVYGDYDCDGVTATVMLYSHLTALGGEVDWYIPSRDEGYGLNSEAIEKIAANGTELIITVDNGITAAEEARLIKEKGISLIITDHHTPPPPENMPKADAIINPKQPDCGYPFKELAGCGVALKLIAALENSDTISVIEQYGDLAAIGTIADIVPLIDENRQIVLLGLESIEYSENIGLHCLMKKAGLSDASGVDSTAAAFILCPRINAAGRFAHAGKAVELLLCENHELASAKAEELNILNQQRIEEERRTIAEIDELLKKEPSLLNERILILTGENWHHGVIGIIASRMVTRFGKPCVIITTDGVIAKGSFRSIEGFSVHDVLSYCGDLLVKFGGHTGAGGLTAENALLPVLKERLLEYAKRNHNVMPITEIIADTIPLSVSLTVENAEKLDSLQPFGKDNPAPVFHLPNCLIKHKRSLKDGKYVSFTVKYQGLELKVLNFSQQYADFWYNIGDTVDLMVNIGINEYNSVESLSVKVVDMRLSGIEQNRFFAASDVYEKIQRNEKIDEKLYSRIIPTDEDMKKVYVLVKKSFCLDEVAQRGLKCGLNYCMLRVIIDVFSEVGLVEFNPLNGSIKAVITSEKADLSKSQVLNRIKSGIY